MIQRQVEKEKARIRQKREESGEQPRVQKALDIAKVGGQRAAEFAGGVVDFVREKSSDPGLGEKREKASRWFGNILIIGICVFVAYCVASLITNFVIHPTKVEGESMETSLTNGDTVLIQKVSYYFRDPERYDVVVFPVPYYNSDTYYIKRVIGMPGETVQIVEGKVYIDGKELKDDKYGKDPVIDDPGDASEPLTLAEDEYFVLGDNRNMSTDSRSSYVGLIRRKNIIGQAWKRIFPISKFGSVDN
ncbi:MAG: signal peptidase I [Lachnospiraceae bacterium]|nr:signal peptidase I [Lachnospiraceae bacterium]